MIWLFYSAAKAGCDHMRDWWMGTAEGSYVSMGVLSDGSYNTPAGVIFSFPVSIKDKKWTILQVNSYIHQLKPMWPA